MSEEKVVFSSVGGVTTTLVLGSDQFSFVTTQDVAPILDRNKALHNEGDGFTPSRDMKYVANIPFIVILEWQEKYGVDVFNKNHVQAVSRLLNSNEYLYLRTSRGRLRK